jgi:hypothetical protein
MPISRPLLIVLIAAVVAAVGFYATQGSRDSNGASAPEVVTPAPAPAPAAKTDSPAKAESKAGAAKPAKAGVPAQVQRAIDDRKTVVLFFYKSGSADDAATARGVAALRGQRNLAVFTAPIGQLARYRGVVGELGISQAPAVVIVRKDGTARVVEGYVDPGTLAQDVADAR